MKRGQCVRVGDRLGIVRRIGTDRICVELDDDKPDPPAGYSAWWKHSDVTPHPPAKPTQVEMFVSE